MSKTLASARMPRLSDKIAAAAPVEAPEAPVTKAKTAPKRKAKAKT